MIKMYKPSLFRDDLSSKSVWVLLSAWYLCKKYGETLNFPSRICRHTQIGKTREELNNISHYSYSDRERQGKDRAEIQKPYSYRERQGNNLKTLPIFT